MTAEETEDAQAWQDNLALGLGVAQAALSALTGGSASDVVVYEEPSVWETYGPWLAAGGGVLVLALLLRR